jgi:hypothetical protein
MTFDALLGKLRGVKRQGTKATAFCPAHQDQAEASLSAAVGADGTILLHCFRGCTFDALCTALGVRPADLFPPKPEAPARRRGRSSSGGGTTRTAFEYRDESGQVLYRSVRIQLSPTQKRFVQQRPDGRGGWIDGLEGVARRLLYRLPELRGQREIVYVEGERHVDALRALGIPATTHAGGAKAFRPDDYVPQLLWAGVRRLILNPDNDPPGRELMAEVLAAALDTGLIAVAWLDLPGLAQKGDVLDWLAAGHSGEALRARIAAAPIVTAPPPLPGAEAPPASAPDAGPAADPAIRAAGGYAIQRGALHRFKKTSDGPVPEPLCNFVATVTEELLLDDGQETNRAYLVSGRLDTGESLPEARVLVEKFPGMSWVGTEWGLGAVVQAGTTTRDHLRAAIQTLSAGAPQRRVFTHTGWRQLEDGWVYLTANGAVGRPDVEVDLGQLDRYRLPPRAEDPKAAMQASLKFLRVAPLTVTAPLLGSIYRAVLGGAVPADYSVWLEGQTGNYKSTVAALALSHWGPFTRLTLPAGWSSTANALERMAFVLKDALFVIDDYAPSPLDARELEAKAARLLRAQGNLVGRSRLRADLTDRPSQPPRGLILATGESHPPGHSILARTLVLELDRREVRLADLTRAQEAAARYPHALAGFIEWAAPQMPSLPALMRESFEQARADATTEAQHARVPEVIAHVWVGLRAAVSYAQDIEACTEAEGEDLEGQCWEALLEVGRAQTSVLEDQRPSRRFFAVLQTLLVQKRAVLLTRDKDPESWRVPPEPVGWFDAEHLYLIGEAAYQAVARFCRDAQELFPIRQERLQMDLLKEGLAVGQGKRPTAVLTVGGKRRRVLQVSREALDTVLGSGFVIPEPATSATSATSSQEEGRDNALF